MKLGIYGAGGLGREVYELAKIINQSDSRWEEIVFIDDSESVSKLRDIPIYKFTEFSQNFKTKDLEVCVAVGEPAIREKLYEKLLGNQISLATVIHPEVSIPESTTIGPGTIICKFVSITCDIEIGSNVYIHPMACIGHDAKIGNNSVISSFVDVAGDCDVGNKTFLAMNVILKQGIRVGNSTIVGISSVVYRDLPDSIIAMGNPARAMKKNEKERVFK